MREVDIPTLRVTATQDRRFRAGLQFGREPRDITSADLPEGLAAVVALAALLADPVLVVLLVDGEDARPVTDEEREALTALLEAEQLRVDPELAPNALAAVGLGAGSGDLGPDRTMLVGGDGSATEGASSGASADEPAGAAAEASAAADEPAAPSATEAQAKPAKPAGRKPAGEKAKD